MPHDPPFDSPLGPRLRLELDGLRDQEFATLAELNASVRARMDHYNSTPQAELAGLSPIEAFELLRGDWETTGPLRLNHELTLHDLADAEFFHNARTLMAELRDRGVVKATAAGNLNRTFVGEMLERMRWPAGFAAEVHRFNRVLNELDVFPLHLLRLVLQLAGLVRKRKGFLISREGLALLDDGRAGELYTLLFRTFFRDLNLGYLDRFPLVEWLQAAVSFALYALARVPAEWAEPQKLAEMVWPPNLQFDEPAPELEARIPGIGWLYAGQATATRLLQPLSRFGLLERRELPPLHGWDRPFEVRKTPLLGRFLRFDFGRPAGLHLLP